MTNETRIAFAEDKIHRGWQMKDTQREFCKRLGIGGLDEAQPPSFWKRLPDPANRSDVHTALMAMSEEEWWQFSCVLFEKQRFQAGDESTDTIERTLKTPLATLVECILAAMEGRVK